jgi:hypothetical protein
MLSVIFMLVLIVTSPGSGGLENSHDLSRVETGTWKLVKIDGGVQTFVRWTTNPDGTPVRERKGEMTVNCSVQDAVNLLTDAGSTGKWMSGVSENYCITRIDKSEWYTYTLFKVPWPFNKRDLVSLFRMESDPSNGKVSIAIVSKDKYMPLKSGITRLVDYKAMWVITRIGDKSIKISFNATSTAPPVVPRPLQDPVLERIFHSNLVRLRETLSV